MAKSAVYKTGPGTGGVSINMTPMIDVTFQLILFFILAGQIASQELANLVLHEPYKSQATDEKALMDNPNRLTVNIPSIHGTEEPETINPAQLGKPGPYKVRMERPIDPDDPGAYEKLVEILRRRKQAVGAKEFFLVIRADRRVSFEYVRPVMEAAAEAQIPKMNITALLATRGG